MKKYNESDAYYDVQAALMPDEELLWVGTPDPMRFAMRHLKTILVGIYLLVALVVMIAVIGFDSFIEIMGYANDIFFLFSLVIIIFTVSGLWKISAPLRQYFIATRTLYGISNQRVLIISGFPSRSTQSFSADKMQFVDTRIHRNGTGDIILRREQKMNPWSGSAIGFGAQNDNIESGFFGV